MPADVFFQVLEDASVKIVVLEPRLINIIEGEDWRAPIMAYLYHYYESDNTNEQIRIQQWARACQIIGNNLYKASVSGPLSWCLSKAEGQEILSEVHGGICGGHIGAHALAGKVLRQGFYWAALIDDAPKLVSTCEDYQFFPPLQVSRTTFVVDRPILAPAEVGHRYRWQTHTGTRKLHLRYRGGGMLHQVG
jgi:hypothetical protein